MLKTYFTILTPYDLTTTFRHRVPAILLCRCIGSLSIIGGTGISTSLSSPTPFGLGLVPDLPWVDKPSPGNLRLSTVRILTALSLLMPAFSLDYSPPYLAVSASARNHCSSTDSFFLINESLNFGDRF